MEIRHLRYFCAIADTLSVSEASRRLRVGQPSLSRQIRDLEQELGAPLFAREKGRLALTPTGAAFRRRASVLVADFDRTLADFQAAGRPTSEIRIGYYGLTWATLLAPALTRFRRLFPHAVLSSVELPPAEILAGLKRGALDLGVLPPGTVTPARGVIIERIGAVPALVALSVDHALAKRRKLDLGDLRNETFLTYRAALARGRDQPLMAACRAAGFRPRLVRDAASLPALLLAIAQNRGIAIVTPFARTSPHPGVVFSQLRPPGVSLDLFVAHRPESPAVVRELAALIASETQRRGIVAGS